MRAVLLACFVVFLCGAPAFATTPELLLEKDSVTLMKADFGWTGEVTLTARGDGEVRMSARPESRVAACEPVVAPVVVTGNVETKVHLVVPAACKVSKNGTKFLLTATAGAESDQHTVTLKAPEDKKTDWAPLNLFWIAAIVAIILILISPLGFNGPHGNEKVDPKVLRGDLYPQFSAEMSKLEINWKLGDSWISNFTVLGGVLTAIFGTSGVVKAILGETADQAVALATVGVAIAGAMVFLGPVVVTMSSTIHKRPRVRGVVCAAMLTLTAALGQLWVVTATGRRIVDGVAKAWLTIAAVAISFMLLGYAFRALRQVLWDGLPKVNAGPPPEPQPRPKARRTVVIEEMDGQRSEGELVEPDVRTVFLEAPRHRSAIL